VVTCGSLVMRMLPDTRTSSMQPQNNLHGASTGPAQVMGQQSKPPPRTQALDAPQPAYQAPAQPAYQAPPQPAYQAPPQPAYQAPPQPAYQAPPQPAYQAPQSPSGDIAAERKRREEAEAAVLTAAERVKVAERRVAELEAQLTIAQHGGGGGGGGGGDEETAKLRRQVEQLQADNRRMRGGQAPGSDAAKVNELQDTVRKLQEELRNKPAGGGTDPQAADAAIALGDALAELRSSLRAASDEATVLTAPSQSVTVVAEALSQATEQLERARAALRTVGRFLGVA
jgi:hypothetical protein